MRSIGAKKYNRICSCVLVSRVRREQELFSYTFNNAYVPKLTL